MLEWQLKPKQEQTIIFGATKYVVEYISEILTEW